MRADSCWQWTVFLMSGLHRGQWSSVARSDPNCGRFCWQNWGLSGRIKPMLWDRIGLNYLIISRFRERTSQPISLRIQVAKKRVCECLKWILVVKHQRHRCHFKEQHPVKRDWKITAWIPIIDWAVLVKSEKLSAVYSLQFAVKNSNGNSLLAAQCRGGT